MDNILKIHALILIMIFVFSSCAVLSKNKLIILTAFMPLLLYTVYMIGFRNSLSGTDTLSYIDYYNNYNNYNNYNIFDGRFELLFEFLIYIFQYIGVPVNVFLFFIFSITITFFLKCFSKEVNIEIILLSLICFISFITGFDLLINVIRNGLAISIGTYAVIKYKSNKKFIFFNFIVIASLIHTSSLIFLLYPVVEHFCQTKNNVKFSFLVFFICIVFSYFNLGKELLSYFALDNIYIYQRVNAYVNDDSNILGGIMKYYFLIVSLIPIVLFFLKMTKSYSILSFFYISIIPYSLIFQSPQSQRFSYIPFGLMIYLIVMAYNNSNVNKKIMILIMMSFSFLITLSTNNVGNIGSVLL